MNDKRPEFKPPVGFPLLGVPDAEGELSFPSFEQSVRQSIEIILRTRPGEQLHDHLAVRARREVPS